MSQNNTTRNSGALYEYHPQKGTSIISNVPLTITRTPGGGYIATGNNHEYGNNINFIPGWLYEYYSAILISIINFFYRHKY